MPKRIAELKPPPHVASELRVRDGIRKRNDAQTIVECRTLVWAEQDLGWEFDLDTIVNVTTASTGTWVTVQYKSDAEWTRLRDLLQ